MKDFGWLIPIILIVIWVINQVAGRARPVERKGAPKPERDRREAADDIDRFLREIERRRRRAEAPRAGKEAAMGEPVAIPVAEPVATAPSPRTVEVPRQAVPAEVVVGTAPMRRLQTRESFVEGRYAPSLPVAEPVSQRVSKPIEGLVAQPDMSAYEKSRDWAPELQEQRNRLRALLTNRSGLQALLMASELLAPPLCLRRRR
ncbi:MAG: hypothetical protein C4297_05180 [Gemmataceae bacterium]